MKLENPKAFPTHSHELKHYVGGQQIETVTDGGMTLRDYFAAKAATGFLMRGECGQGYADRVARMSYNIADTMLAERNKEQVK